MSGNATDPVVLVMKSGWDQHAVTPIAVEDQGNGLWAIWVYDNAFPDVLAEPIEINSIDFIGNRIVWYNWCTKLPRYADAELC